jgi:hypothetical protein
LDSSSCGESKTARAQAIAGSAMVQTLEQPEVETDSFTAGEATAISAAIERRGVDVTDVIRALHRRGFVEEAQNLLNLVRLRLSGDCLQTSALIRDGLKPDNFMAPSMLSELERNHLKDAFVVVKTMQSAASHSHGMGA